MVSPNIDNNKEVNGRQPDYAYELERQFDALNHHAIVSITDAKGDITYVNDLFCEISGYSREELLGNNHRIIKSSVHDAAFYRDIWNTILKGKIWKGEVCNQKKDGSLYWVESTITPFMNKEGKPYQFVSIRTDITHVRRAQESLKQQNELKTALTSSAQVLLSASAGEFERAISFSLKETGHQMRAELAALLMTGEDGSLKVYDCWSPDGAKAPSQAKALLPFFTERMKRHGCRTGCCDGVKCISDITLEHEGVSFEVIAAPLAYDGKVDGFIVYTRSGHAGSAFTEHADHVQLLADMFVNALVRKRNTEKILMLKDRLQKGQLFANIGTWEWNIPEGIIFGSEKIPPLFGCPEAEVEVSYSRFIELVHPDDKDMVECLLYSAINDDTPYEVEHRIIRQDGSFRWILAKGAVVRDEHNKAVRFIGIAQDIDEKKKAQLALEEREQELNRAQELAHIGSWKGDFVTREVTWSREAFRIFGYEPDEVKPSFEGFFELVHPDDLELVMNRIEASATSGLYDVVHRMIKRNGDIAHIHEIGQTVTDAEGNIIAMSGTSQDITDRVLVQQLISESQKRFAFAVEGAGDGIWDWNIQTGDMKHDRCYMEMLGFEESEQAWDMDSWLQSIHPDDAGKVQQKLSAYLEGRKDKFQIELRLRCKHGGYKWTLCRGTVVARNSDDSPLRMIAIHSDIDQFKTIQQELNDARIEAERANHAKSEFLSSMSHELRTPLNSIIGFSQLMEMDETLSEDNRESVHEVLKSGRHLLDLINDILDLAKVESGRLSLSIEPVDLQETLEEVVSLSAPIAKAYGVSIVNRLNARQYVQADRIRLKQVLINLVSNAIKYNKENGLVEIGIREAHAGVITLYVRDTGKGIAEQDLAALFQPFNRLGAENGNIEGTGIGLAITQKMVELMDGKVAVESEPGEGSTFSLLLPVPEQSPQEPEHSAPEVQTAGTAMTGDNKIVLYVDDNPSNLKLVKSILSRMDNIDYIDAHTPELGLDMVEAHFPDLIILDVNMPRLDGYKVLEIIRSNPAFADVPVIALTANAMPRDIEKGLQAGFSDYLTKPLDVDVFRKKVSEFLLECAV